MRRHALRLAWPLLGLVLAPTALGASWSALRALAGLAPHCAASAWFLAGFCAWSLGHFLDFLRWRPAYVFAHEFTHALAAWLSGAKVFDFVVGKDSGHVDLSRVSVFTALAPYWLPFYAVLCVVAYRALLWIKAPPHAHAVFLFLMGASLAFHLSHTIESLWGQRQSDLDHAGFTLSIVLILLLNSLVLLASIKCLFPRWVSLWDSAVLIGRCNQSCWHWGTQFVQQLHIALRP